MKILVVTPCYHSSGSGIEVAASEVAAQYGRFGHVVTLISRIRMRRKDDADSYTWRPVHALNPLEDLCGFPYPILGPRSMLSVIREVARHDMIHVHDGLYISSILATLAARILRRPVIATQHIAMVPYKSIILRMLMETANRLICCPILKLCSGVVFYNDRVTTYFYKKGLSRHKSHFILNGVDQSLFSESNRDLFRLATRRELQLSDSHLIVLFVGRFVEKKGIHLLRKAVQERPDVHFIFVGQGKINPFEWELPNVTVKTNASALELRRLYCASDLLALPSVGEGFPLVVQEATSCGCPCLITADTAAALKTPYPEDLLIRDMTDASIAASIEKILFDDARRECLRKWSREFSKATWCWEKTGSEYVSLLEKIFADSASHKFVSQ